MLTCNRCGTNWPDELEESWGQTKETEGYGPEACCVALVEDKRAKPTEKGDRPLQVCRGRLRYVDEKQEATMLMLTGEEGASAPAVRQLTPIQGGASR